MIVKKIVTSALIVALSSLGIILFAGLFLPASVLNRMIGDDSTETRLATISTTDDTDKIADTNTKENDDTDATKSQDDSATDEAKPAPSGTPSTDTKSSTATSPPAGSAPPKQTATPSPTPSPTPAPAPAPTPPAPACGSGGNCSAAQVASHNTQANCWVIYNNKVYNVTGFVSRHPGGRQVFNSNTCGRDISQYLAGTREPTSGDQFKHTSGDISDINPYFVANLG